MSQTKLLSQFLNKKDDVINIPNKADVASLRLEENNLQSIIEVHNGKEQNVYYLWLSSFLTSTIFDED
ncbi:hypothetical protein L3X37_05625 [Sabulilitoribacter arenilitoris]|uniref:Uncharacterized protein n=1 Tax=Wocania arenilitoris TaxID=2044858 RepID=A0AAE3EPH0_9FLAO|nr:hypothetical protein [Wocania arenilitoris]MCF7567844.1 hypothetical protein [Wocania arenilitoris]